jgi:choline-sulfatase
LDNGVGLSTVEQGTKCQNTISTVENFSNCLERMAAHPLAGFAATEPTPARPNILVFLTDDHGKWAQRAYGNKELRTPNLDRLAARGVRMTNAFTTCPVCSPARASFFTGRMPSQHGIHDWIEEKKVAAVHRALKGQTLISELLKRADYHTGLVGKWHCGSAKSPPPGFDRWFSHWEAQYPHFGVQHFADQDKQVIEHGQQSPLLTERAVDFLRGHRNDPATAGKPFFLFVGYVDTHVPHDQAPADLVEQYKAATFKDIPDEAFPPCHGRAVIPAAPGKDRRKHEEYYGAASSVDREVGKIIAELKSTGQLENTLVVYTADHGLNAGQHGMWEKGNATTPQNFLEESIRVACTISWPAAGIQQNVSCSLPVDHCDLFATLLDAAGAMPDAATAKAINSPGRSYLSQLKGKPIADWRDDQISEYGNARMIRTGRYKLILRYPYLGKAYPHELYDLQADPRETVIGYADPSNAAIVKELSGRLEAYFQIFTFAGHDGKNQETQPVCNNGSPWMRPFERVGS